MIATSPALYAEKARLAYQSLRKTTGKDRNAILASLARLLQDKSEQAVILSANQKDLLAGQNRAPALQERLTLNENRLNKIAGAVQEIIALNDPAGEVIRGHNHPSGMEMIQKRVPLGVLFVIYESRPNVTIDIAALAIKSGNASILRGGKEALHTNRALYALVRRSLEENEMNADSVVFVDDADRKVMLELLKQDKTIDLVVPRGGEGLIQFVSENSRIPVVKHDKGVCNMFIEESADLQTAINIASNAKLQRPSVCNAIENLLIQSSFPQAKEFLSALARAGADLIGDEETCSIFPGARRITDMNFEYGTEYLDNRLSVKFVDSLDDALTFINRYGSGHSEAIVSTNETIIQSFIAGCDSAAIFVNCSTRFHDGGEMGMGAEVGISTGRLHVRGPMGLRDLTTTTWIVKGQGQIRS